MIVYCMKCGKKMPDIALFCPFCGTPSEPDGAKAAPGGDKAPSAAPADPAVLRGEDLPEPEDSPEQAQPPRGQAVEDDLFGEDGSGLPTAPEAFEDDDRSLFAESGEEAFDSDYDDGPSSFYDGGGRFEDEEPSGFFLRHIRGIVGGGLTLMLVLILLLWACTAGGQKVLARMGLAWQSGAYADIGQAEYESGSFLDAASFYEKAFEKESRYAYAINTGVCFDRYGDMDSARSWYVKAINADSRQLEAYLRLLGTYSDRSLISDEAARYIRQGYTVTHDERLNLG